MIPVRVPADLAATLATNHTLAVGGPDHPLRDTECPACGEPLQEGDTIALVYVGRPYDGNTSGWRTGGAVAVHNTCAGPPAGSSE